jgi:hypothetical protein
MVFDLLLTINSGRLNNRIDIENCNFSISTDIASVQRPGTPVAIQACRVC